MKFLFNRQKEISLLGKQITKQNKNIITFSTCWYILKSKFSINTYLYWIQNLFKIMKNFNLVIYTNTESVNYILPLINKTNKNIKIIIKPIESFYTYKYKDNWIKNHENSDMELHKVIDWRLNMLWNEKIFFVNETIKMKYFTSLYYGWCDIGYFRNRPNDLNIEYLRNWPNPIKLLMNSLNDNYIHYGCVQNNPKMYSELSNDIRKHYNENLTSPPTVKYEYVCFAGGFFILKPQLVVNYINIYEEKLVYYFTKDYFIKDDQTILMDIIITNPELFYIHKEDNPKYDNWFMFQRLLL